MNKYDRHDITELLMKVVLITINQPNRPAIKGHSNLIFLFNAESPMNIAVQNETEEGIIQANAGYSITMNCFVSSGMPNETMIWSYYNTVVGVGFKKLDVQRQQQ
jgi:hypothetical protein